jgi:hypothetical protein
MQRRPTPELVVSRDGLIQVMLFELIHHRSNRSQSVSDVVYACRSKRLIAHELFMGQSTIPPITSKDRLLNNIIDDGF